MTHIIPTDLRHVQRAIETAHATIEQFQQQMQTMVRQSRATGAKAAHALSQNFATLASGVLIGISEGFRQKGPGKTKPGRAPKRTVARRPKKGSGKVSR